MAYKFLILALTLSLFGYGSATFNNCQSNNFVIQGTATFVNGQNEFEVVPTDNPAVNRDGSGETFAAPLSGGSGCIYQGIIFDTGASDFQVAQLKCGNDRVEFIGDAGTGAAGSTTTYAIVGGTGKYVGASGTVTEVGQGNMVYQVTANIKVCNCCN